MAAPPIVVHLQAADGALFDVTVPAPTSSRPNVRLAAAQAVTVRAVKQWDGTKWTP